MTTNSNRLFFWKDQTNPESSADSEKKIEFHDQSVELCFYGRRYRHTIDDILHDLSSNYDSVKNGLPKFALIWLGLFMLNLCTLFLEESSKRRILFEVILSGDVHKLRVLKSLPSYKDLSLAFKDPVTGKNTFNASSSMLMYNCVQQYIIEECSAQCIEFKAQDIVDAEHVQKLINFS